jgi:hypothetical protein
MLRQRKIEKSTDDTDASVYVWDVLERFVTENDRYTEAWTKIAFSLSKKEALELLQLP